MRFVIIILAFLASVQLFAQQPNLDSLSEIANKKILAQIDTVKLNKIADRWHQEFITNYAKAVEIAKEKNLVIDTVLEDGTVISLYGIGEFGELKYAKTNNHIAHETISTDKVKVGGGSGYNLTGSTIEIGLWEAGGIPRWTHEQFSSRINIIDNNTSITSHATHVCGTLIGDGTGRSDAEGMAPAATVKAYEVDDYQSEMLLEAKIGLLISNHSWSWIYGWYKDANGDWRWYGNTSFNQNESPIFGNYQEASKKMDDIAYWQPYHLICIAAGNENNEGPLLSPNHYHNDGNVLFSDTHLKDGEIDNGYDCIGDIASAKNVLTVGNIRDINNGYNDPSDVKLVNRSSWGPTDDGRIKPDICANGQWVLSSGHNNNSDYVRKTGTSMSTPSVAGSCALLQEFYLINNSSYMKSATVKALIIHTADEAGTAKGPDYQFGWGLMNTKRAADIINDDKNDVAQINENILYNGDKYNITVGSDGSKPLIVTICWTDTSGRVQNQPILLDDPTPKLVNDLDLRIKKGSNTYEPFILNPSSPSVSATTGDDHLNNVEKIVIDNPQSGFYDIEVNHKGSLYSGEQAFSIIVSGGESCFSHLEPNNDFNDATSPFPNINTPTFTDNIKSNLYAPYDIDYFVVGMDVTGVLSISLEELSADYDLYLYDIHRSLIDESKNSGTTSEMVTFYNNTGSSAVYVAVSAKNGTQTNCQPYNLKVNFDQCNDNLEPNNSFSDAVEVTPPPFSTVAEQRNYHSYISSSNDEDWYIIGFDATGTLNIGLSDLPENYKLELFDNDGTTLINDSDNPGTSDEQITYNYATPLSTTRYIKVSSSSGAFDECDGYRLNFNWQPGTSTCPVPITFNLTSTDVTGINTNDGTASVSNISGGTAPYTITWSNNTTGNSITGLSPGIYTVTVEGSNNCPANIKTFNIKGGCGSAAPNNLPCCASVVPVGSGSICPWNTANITINHTQYDNLPIPACDSPGTRDVWYQFEVPPSGIISFQSRHSHPQNSQINDIGAAIYSGTCSNLTEILCIKNNLPDYMPDTADITLTGFGVQPGETVFLRMWEFGNNWDHVGPFEFCISEEPVTCDESVLSISKTDHFTNPVTLGEDILVAQEHASINWEATAVQTVNNAVVGIYDGTTELYRQLIAAPQGGTVTFNPAPFLFNTTAAVGGEERIISMRMVNGINDFNLLNYGSPLVCQDTITVYPQNIEVASLSQFIYETGDPIDFQVQKNMQEPLKLEVDKLSGTPFTNAINNSLDFIPHTVPFTGPMGDCEYNWTIPANYPNGAYELIASGTVNAQVSDRGANFLIGSCLTPPIRFVDQLLFATEYLCFLGLIPAQLDSAQVVHDPIELAEACMLTYNALYHDQSAADVPTDDFPVPFKNLQASNSGEAYYIPAKALYYLTYDDAESALPRDYFYFDNDGPVSGGLAVRLLLEAFNIPVAASNANFVPAGHPYAKWINYARDVNIIPATFAPDQSITYADFYVLVFKIMTEYGLSINIPAPVTKGEDYYVPGNYALEAMPYHLSLTDGVFNYTGDAPFSIPGKGLPLTFSFGYNSAETDLPNEFFSDPLDVNGYDFQPLGKGWWHNYNARVFKNTGGGDTKYVFVWPGNRITTYDAGSGSFDAYSIYDEVNISANQIELSTKSLMTYVFEEVSGEDFYILKTIRDQFNNELSLDYATQNGLPKLDKVTDQQNTSAYLQFNYSSSDPWKLQSVSESVKGRTVQFEVINDSLTRYRDVMHGQSGFNGEYTYSYSASEDQWRYLLTDIQFPRAGSKLKISYANNKLIAQRNGVSTTISIWRQHYDSGNPDKFTSCILSDEVNYITRYEKDEFGRLRSFSSPTVDLSISTFDSGNGRMLPTEWSQNQIDFSATYDGRGNMEDLTKSSGSLTISSSRTWDANNNMLSYTDPENNTYYFDYNSSNNSLEKITLPGGFGDYKVNQRNATGQVGEVEAPSGLKTEFDYNTSGHLNKILNVATGSQTNLIPDDIGRVTNISDPNSNNSSISYLDNSVVNSSGDDMLSLDYEFDENYLLSKINHNSSYEVERSHTDENWLNEHNFGSSTYSVEYNKDGSPKRIYKGNKQGDFSYNATTRQLESDPTNLYQYDSRSRVVKITNTTYNIVLDIDYDDLNRIKEVTSTQGSRVKKVAYEYNGNDNITAIHYGGFGSARVVNYSYDALGRCTEVFDWKDSDPLVTYTYDSDSRLLKEEFRNGTWTEYEYEDGRLIGISNYLNNNQRICWNTFTLDAGGFHSEEEFGIPGSSIATPQQVFSITDYGQAPFNQTQSITQNGNVDDLEFDAAGNVTKIGNMQFDWDFDDQLKTAWRNSSDKAAEYKYDGMGHRRHKKLHNNPVFPGLSEVFYNIDIHGMGNVLSEEFLHSNGTVHTTYYIHSPNGLIARHIGNATEFYHYDYRGSVLATTNQDKVITHSFRYDIDGLITHSAGQHYDADYPMSFTYIGRWGVQRDVLNLYFMRERYLYQPLGKFLEEDPVFSGNLYAYSNNNAMDFIDPDGNLFKRADIDYIPCGDHVLDNNRRTIRKIIKYIDENKHTGKTECELTSEFFKRRVNRIDLARAITAGVKASSETFLFAVGTAATGGVSSFLSGYSYGLSTADNLNTIHGAVKSRHNYRNTGNTTSAKGYLGDFRDSNAGKALFISGDVANIGSSLMNLTSGQISSKYEVYLELISITQSRFSIETEINR